jgi:hypothetical protein
LNNKKAFETSLEYDLKNIINILFLLQLATAFFKVDPTTRMPDVPRPFDSIQVYTLNIRNVSLEACVVYI